MLVTVQRDGYAQEHTGSMLDAGSHRGRAHSHQYEHVFTAKISLKLRPHACSPRRTPGKAQGRASCHLFQHSPMWRLAQRLPVLSGTSVSAQQTSPHAHKSHQGMPSILAQALHRKSIAKSFTVLFTARVGGVPLGSAAGCGPFLICFRSCEPLGHW